MLLQQLVLKAGNTDPLLVESTGQVKVVQFTVALVHVEHLELPCCHPLLYLTL